MQGNCISLQRKTLRGDAHRNPLPEKKLITYIFPLYNTFVTFSLKKSKKMLQLSKVVYEMGMRQVLRGDIVLKKKITIWSVFLLFAFMVFSLPARAAKIPIIRNGKATSLKGSIVSVRYGSQKVGVSSVNGAPAVKIGSDIYIPCKTLFADNGIHAAYTVGQGGKIVFRYGKRKVVFFSNKKYAKVNGTKMKLEFAPYIVTFQKSGIEDLLVPARQAASFFGLKYSYSSKTKTVTLNVRDGIHNSATRDKNISKSSFIEKLGPIARANYRRTGILASVTMAQAILESGWGQSSLAQNGNNLFGMKTNLSGNNWSGSAWDGVNYYRKSTYEYGSGGRYSIKANFRKYSCVEDSIEDHSAYLLKAKNGSRKRYAGLTKTKSYKKQLQIIKNGGYATSGSYVSQLCRVISTYNLTKWDKL